MHTVRSLAVLLAVAAALPACAWFGPEVIRSGRPAYNDAILATNDEQLLKNIVRTRYGDGLGFLTVSSVTANVTLSAGGAVNLGFGSSAAYQSNLVPFAGTVSSEQNPTIAFSPVSGDRVLRQMAGETPLDLAILSMRAAHSQKQAFTWLVRRVNDIRNHDFLEPPGTAVDPRFDEVTALIGVLHDRGCLYWARLQGTAPGFGFVLHNYRETAAAEAARLMDVLQIPRPAREGDDVIVPVVLAAGAPDAGSVALETRSLRGMMRLAAAAIELPPDTPGAMRFPVRGPGASGIRIRTASERPAGARVAVEHRDRWYYIDDADETTKQWFEMITLLFNAQVPEPVSASAPVFTIPVAGRR